MTAVAANQNISPLSRPVSTLWGVGPERSEQLKRLEICTVEDLLLHRPRRYEDRRQFRPIRQLVLDEPAITRGNVVALGVKWFRKRQKSIFELILDDGSARLHCRWWNLPFMEKYFAVGEEVIVFGKMKSIKPRTIDHPETEIIVTGEENLIHLNRITPIYPLTEGVPQRWLRALIWRTLRQQDGRTERGSAVLSSLDTRHSTLGTLPDRESAIQMLHFPEAVEEIELARRRLALDELIELQRGILLRRRAFETKARALPCRGDNHLIKPFLARLGFKLTEAQTKVLREMRKDMSAEFPMRRLLQGDVGSGKTAVAACCALMALESGYNVALMAPTEILAEQHYRNFRSWFEPLKVSVKLQTGSHKSDEWQVARDEGRARGEGRGAGSERAASSLDTRHSTLFVGTHALFTEGFDLPNLGLVIIDEQHKFGVSQREQLLRKGRYPHLLVMTATPIPRTLGLTIYGELDSSVIDELPPGRGRVQTFMRTEDKLPKVWDFIRSQLSQKRQAYVVYPRVEETGQSGLKAVTKEFDHLKELLNPYKVALLHGRMKSNEKEEVMAAFRANAIQVLLATSLIEVGVDVPNATVMLIENAEQFGMAQLHQLRGRIGRGAQQSYCILVSGAKNEEAKERLKVLEETTDGFRIAEADLKLRGPGELLGQQQSGMPKFRFADLSTDLELVNQARRLAAESLES